LLAGGGCGAWRHGSRDYRTTFPGQSGFYVLVAGTVPLYPSTACLPAPHYGGAVDDVEGYPPEKLPAKQLKSVGANGPERSWGEKLKPSLQQARQRLQDHTVPAEHRSCSPRIPPGILPSPHGRIGRRGWAHRSVTCGHLQRQNIDDIIRRSMRSNRPQHRPLAIGRRVEGSWACTCGHFSAKYSANPLATPPTHKIKPVRLKTFHWPQP